MATEVGQAYVTLIPSAKGFARKMESEIAGEMGHAGRAAGDDYGDAFNREANATIRKTSGGLGKSLGTAMLAGFAAVGVGRFIGDMFSEATEAAVTTARTTNVIESMGNVAHISADQVGELATAISLKTGIDDEAIQAGENLLLTFGNVRNEVGKGNDVFNQATTLGVDMSKALGKDATSSAKVLGKALNDPVKGMAALSKVGVQFTDEQKAQIQAQVEAGDTLGAQKTILEEVKKKFGGAGAAMATPGEKAKVAFDNLKETLGTALLPTLSGVLTAVAAALPGIADFAVQVGTVLAPAFTAAYDAAKFLFDLIMNNQTTFEVIAVAIGVVVAITLAHAAAIAIQTGALMEWLLATKLVSAATKAWAAVQWILDAAMAANPIGLIIIAIAALILIVVLIVKKFGLWDDIVRGVGKAFSWLKGLISSVWGGIKKVVTGGISALVGFLKALPGKMAGALKSLGGKLADVFRRAWDNAKKAVSAGIDAVVNFVKKLPGRLLKLGGELLKVGKAIIGKFVDGMKSATGIISGIAGNVWDTLRGLINGAISKINAALSFTISLPLGKSISINPPDIPQLAGGARVTGATLAVIGEGREAETVLPDSMLAGLLGRAGGGGGGGELSGELTITNWDDGTGFIRLIAADEVSADARFRRHLGAMHA